jgi:hypothetical protein
MGLVRERSRLKILLLTAVALLASAAAGSPARADSGPAAEWRLDEGAGTLVSNSVGPDNSGTIIGAAQWVLGHSGTALSFDGSNSGVRVRRSAAIEPAGAVSVAAWVKQAGSPGAYRYIVAKGANVCDSASYALYTGPNGGLYFYVAHGQPRSYILSPDAGTGVWDGAWHLVVGTYDGSRVRVFVDGQQVGSGTPDSAPIDYVRDGIADLYIGHYPAAQLYPGCQAGSFPGIIDDPSVWGRALSPDDIGAMISSPGSGHTGSAPSTSPSLPPAPAQTQSSSHRIATNTLMPKIRDLKLASKPAHRARHLVIVYRDSQPAHTTFTIMLVRSGRCVRTRHRHCARAAVVARFAHADKAGANAMALRLELPPGHYVLTATPRRAGHTGETVRIAFALRR